MQLLRFMDLTDSTIGMADSERPDLPLIGHADERACTCARRNFAFMTGLVWSPYWIRDQR